MQHVTDEEQPIEINGVRYFNAADVARTVGISRSTLTRWRRDGKVPPGHRFRNRHILFRFDEVDAVRRYAMHLEPADTRDRDEPQQGVET
jgi:predicted DNA-binding transcriptional regulator AlpA